MKNTNLGHDKMIWCLATAQVSLFNTPLKAFFD